jgi:hypothetical protein
VLKRAVRSLWLLQVTSCLFTVTAEVAGSSPVVPAIHSIALTDEWDLSDILEVVAIFWQRFGILATASNLLCAGGILE